MSSWAFPVQKRAARFCLYLDKDGKPSVITFLDKAPSPELVQQITDELQRSKSKVLILGSEWEVRTA